MIWCCGKNAEGELGLGNEEKVNIPKNVDQLNDFQVKDIQASNTHTVLMTPKGDIHVAGSSLHGKLGIEKINKKSLNKFHVVVQLEGEKVKQVCCNDYVTIVLLENGQVFQLGGTNMMDKSVIPNDANEAQGVPGLEGVHVISIACGDYHGVALDENGHVYTWGGGKN